MNHDVTVAVLRLQDSLMNKRLPHWRVEQTEEALNGLLSHPDRVGEPFHLERNAMSDARKKLQRRATLFAEHVGGIEVMAEVAIASAPDAEPFDILRADIVDIIARTGGDTDREILNIALHGGGAGEVAEALGVTYDIAKVRLSRARQRARVAWGHA